MDSNGINISDCEVKLQKRQSHCWGGQRTSSGSRRITTVWNTSPPRKDLNDYILKYQAAPKLLDEVYPVRVDLKEFIQILQSKPLKELCS